MKKILFIYNPISGKGLVKLKLSYIVEKLSNEGLLTVIPTKEKGDATKYVMEYMDNYDLIVCSGGDGTLNEVTVGYMSVEPNKRKPCAYIPAGTVNDFATSLGISKNITKCVDDIASSTIFPYDIGEFNNRYFTYIAGFGAFTDVSYSTPQNVKNILGKAAYILEGIKHLPKIKSIDVTITSDGKKTECSLIYGMICNTFSVGGLIKIGEEDIALDDGKFEAVFVKSPKNPIELQETINDILMNKLNSKHFLYMRGNDFTIESENEIPWTLDGEFGGNIKIAKITNHPRAINFLKPKVNK
jgi:YegS/Rv2252/BmrU family lipid kinase